MISREQQIELLQKKKHKEFMKPECLKKNIDRVVINVGGSRHECYISTIQNFPDTRLFWIAETALAMENVNVEASEFFFDRHPGCFENILNYCRTGRLHCPKDVCGPLFQEELEFWGVDELMMQPCCWPNYSEYREVNKNLKIFQVEEEEHCSTENELDEFFKERESHKSISKKIWDFLETPKNSYYANIVAGVNIFIVVLSIATFCLSTEKQFSNHNELFASFEKFYCTFFTLDLVLRIFCCPSKIKLFKDYLTWFDIVSLLPFYCELAFNLEEIRFLLPFRLFRIFRLLRYVKNLRGMIVIGETLKASFEQLLLLILVLTIPMVVFATMVYYAEKNTIDSKFESIPRSFWWAIITLTTVGYGDMSPVSLAGKIIGGFCATFGILMSALPISVIGSNFSFYYSYAKAKMELPKHELKMLVNADQTLKGKTDGELKTLNRKRRHALNAYDSTLEYRDHSESIKSVLNQTVSVAIKPDTLNSFTSKTNDYSNEKCIETSYQNNIHENGFEHNVVLRRKSRSNLETSRIDINAENQRVVNGDNLNERLTKTRSFTTIEHSNSDPIKNDHLYSVDLNKLNHENKRTIHLDIGQYQPTKLSNRDRADIRRKISHTHFQKNNPQINEIKHRSLSIIRQETVNNEVLVWCDDLKEISCK
ncbi:potassium voltage-gated channel subfamily C member 1 isoform X6 [Hydra vulgaris]|uniref:Potassium voltage-gated channel subfamily C member 1 isoform X6 n=1 Tax=Hydra vulgaris TaxID=6087 RepID=A0ABM4C6Z8_HYDVU